MTFYKLTKPVENDKVVLETLDKHKNNYTDLLWLASGYGRKIIVIKKKL